MSSQQLFTPFTFPATCKQMHNRISLAPLTNLQSHEDGTLSNDEYNWLVRRAKENFGMVITCAANVSADGQGWKGPTSASIRSCPPTGARMQYSR